MTLNVSLNLKYVYQEILTGKIDAEILSFERVIEEELSKSMTIHKLGYLLIKKCRSVNAFDKNNNEIFDGDILKINELFYIVKIINSAAALIYPNQDDFFEYICNLSPNNYVGEIVGNIHSNPNFFQEQL